MDDRDDPAAGETYWPAVFLYREAYGLAVERRRLGTLDDGASAEVLAEMVRAGQAEGCEPDAAAIVEAAVRDAGRGMRPRW